ncbi:MAG: LysM peptidoglycan-binding domain-containing protein, partial [Rhodobacteraceae bacterium]|nr:LysM peptidoglycan-binding domain-containing protein [Paracoccaceae bacterium]
MTGKNTQTILRMTLLGASVLTLGACMGGGQFDPDFRKFGTAGFSTADAALQATANRPVPDQRGIISYPGYQVAVARQGDTVASVAARVGLSPDELAGYNALSPNAVLRQGEVVALPRRVADMATGAAPMAGAMAGARPPTTPGSSGRIDVSSITSGKIAPAPVAAVPAAAKPAQVAVKPAPVQTGAEPIRHKVERGESAYSIARLYNVNVKALADWNGLGSDLSVREGQILLVPVGKGAAPAPATATKPCAPAGASSAKLASKRTKATAPEAP